MLSQLIGEALSIGLQGLVVVALCLFVRSFYRDLAGLCSRKESR